MYGATEETHNTLQGIIIVFDQTLKSKINLKEFIGIWYAYMQIAQLC